MKEFWNDRYAAQEYVYGKDPNVFFRSWVDNSTPGKMLLPGEGEGRNAVYAATAGWEVYAFDQSDNAREKALKLAKDRNVEINYRLGSLLDKPLEEESYDMVGLIYFHLFPEARRIYHAHLASALKPGGLIVIEAFSKEQINNNTGGPKDVSLLYSLDDLINDFSGLEVVVAALEECLLDEGPFHQGMAELVKFVGRKE